MLPKTRAGERKHRKRKREMEIRMIVERISTTLNRKVDHDNSRIEILEFGSGDGFQVPLLKRIGKVIASDIHMSDGIASLRDVEFVECSIENTPFPDAQFDVVFSNHVIEHVGDVTNALREAKRIGKPSCIYAFSVPTNTWLLLSIPAQYFNNLRTGHWRAFWRMLRPRGHGVTKNFIECYRKFRISAWQRMFCDSGFFIIEVKPLLLYGPSEWPVIPTLRSKRWICSSVLFLMTKQA